MEMMYDGISTYKNDFTSLQTHSICTKSDNASIQVQQKHVSSDSCILNQNVVKKMKNCQYLNVAKVASSVK